MSRAKSTRRHRLGRAGTAAFSTVAADWLQAAIPSAADTARKSDEVVHDLRTAAKRARALVRLFGDALGERVRRQENLRLRDAAHALAGARDAAVARALLHKLRRKHRGRTAAAIAAALRGLGRHPSAALSVEETHAAIAHARATLRATARKLRQLRRSPADARGGIEAALRASYCRSRHQMRQARHSADATAWHEWRKLTKRLCYQLQFPGLTQSRRGRRRVRRLDELQERLGVEHDTQLVMALLRATPARFGTAGQTARINVLLEQRAAKLRARCLRLGALVFADQPAAFARRVRRWLRRWEATPRRAFARAANQLPTQA